MRQQACPKCGEKITFSWADFVFLNNWGKARLFCLKCKETCTISNTTSGISFAISVGGVALLYALIFYSGLLSPPEYAKGIFIILSIPVIMVVRAIATERFAELTAE
jgi:hypothetical protein